MKRAFQEIPSEVPSKTLRPDFEDYFEKTWLSGMVTAGINHIVSIADVGEYGAEKMFWSAISKALASHLHDGVEFAYEFDRNISPEERTLRRAACADDLDTEIPF